MTERDFVYWLQGYLEVSKTETLDKEQLDQVKKHIALVLKRVVDVPAPINFFDSTTRIC